MLEKELYNTIYDVFPHLIRKAGKIRTESGAKRSEVRELVEIFRGQIVDVGEQEVMIEISGRESKIEAFIKRMLPFGIIELVRTGRIAMVRGGTKAQEDRAEPQLHESSISKYISS